MTDEDARALIRQPKRLAPGSTVRWRLVLGHPHNQCRVRFEVVGTGGQRFIVQGQHYVRERERFGYVISLPGGQKLVKMENRPEHPDPVRGRTNEPHLHLYHEDFAQVAEELPYTEATDLFTLDTPAREAFLAFLEYCGIEGEEDFWYHESWTGSLF